MAVEIRRLGSHEIPESMHVVRALRVPGMPSTSAAVGDALCSLLDAERGSIFRLMQSGSRYAAALAPPVRQLLQHMNESSYRHEREIGDMLRQLGDDPDGRPDRLPEEPYLEFLSQRFLLAKLESEKELLIRFYENALRAIGQENPQVRQSLQRHLDQHRADSQALHLAMTPGGAAAGY